MLSKKLSINRSDRIGDAIISLPFIQCFIEYMQGKGWKGEVKILSSKGNHSILKALDKYENVEVSLVSEEFYQEYSRDFFRTLGGILNFYKLFLFRKKKKSETLFIDLLDTVTELREYANIDEIHDAFWMSANRGPLNLCFNITYPYRYTRDGHQLNANYLDSFERAFGWKDFADYVYSRESLFYTPANHNNVSLLFFLSVKRMRDIGVDLWKKIIYDVIKVADFPIVLMDIEESDLILALKKEFEGYSNVEIVIKKMPFDDFRKYASEFGGVIGVDGGGINLIRSLTNSLTIFTLADPGVWSPYRLNKKLTTKDCGKDWYFNSIKGETGQTYTHIYKKDFWLPSFQMALPDKNIWNSLDTKKLAKYILEHFFAKK